MKKASLLLLIILFVSPIFAAYNSKSVPDSSEIRKSLVEKWFEAPLSAVRMNLPEIYNNPAGEKFQVRLEESDTTYNIFVSPQKKIKVDVYSDLGKETKEQEVYPGDAPGSWVLIKDKKTEKILRIRYYFLKNSEVFIQFTPRGKTALADLVIFGNYAARGVPTGVPFTTFYSASFDRVMNITKNSLPWNYVDVDPSMYHSVLQMAAVIQERLPNILFAPDAMYDENGELIQIFSGKPYDEIQTDDDRMMLSSAGFLKWIADGLVEPIAGGRIKREPLLQETVQVKETGLQGSLSQKYNLYFSLDWIRNLASAVISVYTGKTYKFNQSGVDVTINPFASTISPTGVANVVTFVENSGYSVDVLKSLLYVLATTEPSTIYFGAIRETDRTVSPEVKVFNQCVAFLPYFATDGSFNAYVFMNGRSISLEEFCNIYSDTFVYLTRVKASERFFPQEK